MKTLTSILTLLLLLLSVSILSAQNADLSQANIEQLREERAIYLFNTQNKIDIAKKNTMVKLEVVSEKADLQNKTHEVAVVNDPSFPKYVETNDPQKGSWEYAQAKKEWIAANPDKYEAMMNRTSSN